MSFRLAAVIAAAPLSVAVPAAAQLLDILTAPKTLIERAVEDRSMGDIARDNEIALKVNGLVAQIGAIQASTTIYEQRLLITGLFDDREKYEKFRKAVRAVKDVKKLYWHAIYMPGPEQEAQEKAGRMKSWAGALGLATKAESLLATTAGVSHTNYRTPVDPMGTLYLLGRALSKAEREAAVRTMRSMDGIRRVVDFVEVRPKR